MQTPELVLETKSPRLLLYSVPGHPNYAISRRGRVFRVTPCPSGKNAGRPVPYEIHPWVASQSGKPYVCLSTRTISVARLLKITFPSG